MINSTSHPKFSLFSALFVLLLFIGCSRDEEEPAYDVNSTEFRFGHNNAAVNVTTFNSTRILRAATSGGPRQIYDSLDVDMDQIADFSFEASYGNVPAANLEFGGISIISRTGLYQFLMGPILFDTIYHCYNGNDTFAYNLASNYSCANSKAVGFEIVKQAISFSFGDAAGNPTSNPDYGWDNQSAPFCQFSSGYSFKYQSDYRFENFPIPNNKELYIQFQNRLTGQLGWLHLKVVNFSELQIYDYALEKLI
ncbi:MAG: hypothetical protein NXI09_04745 [Bacteroidetes bacterium]|nr:hypothetical protein [Bacteroidota bacterium]